MTQSGARQPSEGHYIRPAFGAPATPDRLWPMGIEPRLGAGNAAIPSDHDDRNQTYRRCNDTTEAVDNGSEKLNQITVDVASGDNDASIPASDPIPVSMGWVDTGEQLERDLTFPFHGMPGSDLVSRLVAAEPVEVSSQDLGDGIAAWERLAAWAKAQQYAWIAELDARCVREFSERTRGMLVGEPVGRVAAAVGANKDVSSAELSAILTISHYDAKRRVETATALHTYLFETQEALEAGVITSSKAELMATRLAKVDPMTAIAVEATTLDTAYMKPRKEFAKAIESALIAVDPDGADARQLLARTERRVERPKALPDGMAVWRAILPAEQALQAHRALTSAARAAKCKNEPRTMDQLRADILGSALTQSGEPHAGIERTGQQSDDNQQPSDRAARGDTPQGSHRCGYEVLITIPVSQLTGDANSSGDTTSDAVTDLEVANGAYASGVGAGGARAGGADVDGAITGGVGTRGAITGGAITGGAGTGGAGTGGADSERMDAGCPATDRDAADSGICSHNDRTAILTGYGPVGAVLARMIASDPRSRWRLATVDDHTGRILDIAKRTYRPPPDLARLVRAREPVCVFPSCFQPSGSCDLDHTRPFDHDSPANGGQTCPANLAPLCRTHHNLKTLGLWELDQPSEGVLTWTSTLGRVLQPEPTRSESPTITVEEIFGETAMNIDQAKTQNECVTSPVADHGDVGCEELIGNAGSSEPSTGNGVTRAGPNGEGQPRHDATYSNPTCSDAHAPPF